MDRIPYTYLIGWSSHDLWYYGVRHGKGCHPDDLWVKYFTSSERISCLRNNIGEPDVVQIRKIFADKKKAVLWEHRVLTRCGAVKSTKWVNANASGIKFYADELACQRISIAKKGVPKSAEHIEKIRIAKTGLKQSAETVEKRADALRGMKRTDAQKAAYAEVQNRPEQRKQRSDNLKGTMRYCLSDGTYFARLKMVDPRIAEMGLIPQVTTLQRETARSHVNMMAQRNVGTVIYNNSINEIKRHSHPGDGWTEGRLLRSDDHREAQRNAIVARIAGSTTWTDGHRNYRLMPGTIPEPHWTKGMAPRRPKVG